MKKKLTYIVVIVVVAVLICFGVIKFGFKQEENVSVENNKISTETMTATIFDVGYNDGWLSGKILIDDEYFDEYMKNYTEENIIEHFSSYYDVSYMTSKVKDVLPSSNVGYVVSDNGNGYYYEEFNIYISMEEKSLNVQIYVNGIEDPLVIKLKGF